MCLRPHPEHLHRLVLGRLLRGRRALQLEELHFLVTAGGDGRNARAPRGHRESGAAFQMTGHWKEGGVGWTQTGMVTTPASPLVTMVLFE